MANVFDKAHIKPTLAPQKYHHLLVTGLVNNGNEVQCISALPVTSKSHDKKFWGTSHDIECGVRYKYSFFVNWAPLKFLSQIVYSFFATSLFLLRNRECKNVITDILNWPIALGGTIAARLFGRNVTGIVTDLPEMVLNMSAFYMKYSYKKIYDNCTSYVLITEQMNERINPSKKPYEVIEGLVDRDIPLLSNPYFTDGKKHITYTGAILSQYGVQNLIEGFMNYVDADAVLDIFGNGDLRECMRSYQNKDSRIHYHGVVNNVDAVRAQMSSTLLINPRPTIEDFTKYSFPIKNMEYLATGVPTASTALAGMPQEYIDRLLIIKDFSKDGIAEFLKKTLSRSKAELNAIGEEGRRFVLEEKNNNVQAKKLTDFLRKTTNEQESID